MATVPGLRNMLSQPESAERNTRTIAAPDATPSRHDETTYDGKKREPQFANAQNSCLWEIVRGCRLGPCASFPPLTSLVADRFPS